MIPAGTPVFTSAQVSKGKAKGRAGKIVGIDAESVTIELDATADLESETVTLPLDQAELLR
jgi:hypothetical protein